MARVWYFNTTLEQISILETLIFFQKNALLNFLLKKKKHPNFDFDLICNTYVMLWLNLPQFLCFFAGLFFEVLFNCPDNIFNDTLPSVSRSTKNNQIKWPLWSVDHPECRLMYFLEKKHCLSSKGQILDSSQDNKHSLVRRNKKFDHAATYLE